MSKLSIYESGWINLVFEGKNQEYGAYQLRRDDTKTTVTAFFAGLLLITALACIPLIVNLAREKTQPVTLPEIKDKVIQVTLIQPELPKIPKQVLPVVKRSIADVKPKQQLIKPEIVKPENATPDIATNKDHSEKPATTASGTDITGTNPVQGSNSGTAIEVPLKPNETPAPMMTVDVMPEFPGGVKKFLDYVGNNFEKPQIEMTVSVLMSFVIEKDGTMTDIKVLRNPGYGLDKEAVRVLKSLKTKWKPGIKNGQPIRVLYTLPIKVQP